MSMTARVLLTSSAVLFAVSITAATVLSNGLRIAASTQAEPSMVAPLAPVYVTPTPMAFDLESDNPSYLAIP